MALPSERLLIINRTQEHAIDLTQRFGAVHRSFAELAATLVEADVVISSTSTPLALLTPALVQEVMKQRGGRSLLLLDIALPRDVDPSVGSLPGIHLYNLDDLHAEVSPGMPRRMQEVEQVQSIIAENVGEFERWLRSHSVVATISDLRQRVDVFRKLELARTMGQLSCLSKSTQKCLHTLK
ncbi:hypothetical protein [Ktedonobacter racemifer]|uniref:hypothetical protein n=1 Tax=Ktedonobacter racemifer TaxID=363277 RepID=UPI0009FF72FE|nr:hypothetical protein [Ktedonobacter racemifer]